MNSPADPLATFEDQRSKSSTLQDACRGKTRRAGANNQSIIRHINNLQRTWPKSE
jgi:hypothetical protein